MIHQAAAGKAGHPLYLADGLQQRYLRRAKVEGANIAKFFGLNHGIFGRGSVIGTLHPGAVGVVGAFLMVRVISELRASSSRLSETNRDESER